MRIRAYQMSSGESRLASNIAERWTWCALFAVVVAAFSSMPAYAQSLELHAAFNDVRDKVVDDSQAATPEVRIAVAPKPPAKTSKPAAQPVVQKSGAAATRVKQAPRPR